MDARLASRFRLGPKIGCGSFGEIFIGTDGETGREVAIKLEPSTATRRCLTREVYAYELLQAFDRVPALHWYGRAGEYRMMVIGLLGPSLQDLLDFCGGRFGLKTVLALADQMLTCIEGVHACGLIHRDIKPDNFLVGLGRFATKVHIIDFGLAGCYIDSAKKKHIEYREGRGLTGTPCFLSCNAHLSIEASRRDDLESLGYIMVYLLRGSLPWQGLKGSTKQESHARIRDAKLGASVEDLCKGLPAEIATFLSYCRGLEFEAGPDYGRLRLLLRDLFVRRGYCDDDFFDWTTLTTGIQQRESRVTAEIKDKQEHCKTTETGGSRYAVDGSEEWQPTVTGT